MTPRTTKKNANATPLTNDEMAKALKAFRSLRVLVIGDLFLDEYIRSEMYEVSKEGPIPVVRVDGKEQAAGAAGNLAASIRNLGAQVSLVAVVGSDANGQVLRRDLRSKRIQTTGILVEKEMRTLTYTKVRAQVDNSPSQEILRMDILPDEPLKPILERKIIAAVKQEAKNVDVIVVLDQIDHLITETVLAALPDIARKNGALLHGSSRERIGLFRNFDLLIPNDRETHAAVGGEFEIERLGRTLKRHGAHSQVLLTLGAEGMALFPQRGRSSRVPSLATQVVDVTGAGDAVSSTAALANGLGWNLTAVARAASHAAAIAVGKIGTYHVTQSELRTHILKPSLS